VLIVVVRRRGDVSAAAQGDRSFVDAAAIPQSNLAPDRATLLLVTPSAFPSIAEVAEVELRLAGLRINPMYRATARRPFAHQDQRCPRTPDAATRATTSSCVAWASTSWPIS
jgi:hypothetical protein